MARDFCILVDVGDKRLADYAVDTALSLETSGHLVVVEAHPRARSLPDGHPFALAIFDKLARTPSEVQLLSSTLQASGLPIVSVHVGGQLDAESLSRVVGVSRELFEETFLQLLAFCYISHLVRDVLTDARKML
jgi:hypothetical protein